MLLDKIKMAIVLSLFVSASTSMAGICKSDEFRAPADDYGRLYAEMSSLDSCLRCSKLDHYWCGDQSNRNFIYKVQIDGKTVAIHFIRNGNIVSTIPASE